jgi:hypothetical protein
VSLLLCVHSSGELCAEHRIEQERTHISEKHRRLG